MIISISGKIGSGKDTVGNIMHYLINKHKGYITGEFDVNLSYSIGFSGFETKKFADKLKDIACMLIGCTRDQLEDQEFKKTMLDDSWRFYTENGDSHTYTVREFLQKLGTEAMRDVIHENVWVNALMCDYVPKQDKSFDESFKEQLLYGESAIRVEFPNWIITDTRFPNELEAVKQRGGITIRVSRNLQKDRTCLDCYHSFNFEEMAESKECPKCKSFNYAGVLLEHSSHPSETALDDATFDYEIVNDGSIEELISKVEEILIKENLL